MDCTLIIPVSVVKFSHSALSFLLAAQLGISGEIGVSCDWKEGATVNDPPEKCVVELPKGYKCEEIPDNIFKMYSPVESDMEESTRKIAEEKRKDPLIKELLDRIDALEKENAGRR